ncbi:Cytochrome P450 3A12 [Rhizoctonia solani]|uniref:Cytochrome P450 3A12 n=1 Tax=Rhizoctonia solani TaxID=456999 RepID=A0A0K6FM58_9AGAM|nr:Cytochrome P450 3A12 [Rhizoctonia solani]
MPIFTNTAKEICDFFSKQVSTSKLSKEINVLGGATAAAIDSIGKIGFGYSFNSFKEEQNNYSDSIQDVTQSLIRIGPLIQLLPYVQRLGTPAFRRWMLKISPFGAIRQLRNAVNFQNEQADKILRIRQELISSGVDISSEAGGGKDIITLLMKAEGREDSTIFTDREILVGHMNVLIAGGHETTSTATARILDKLAHNQGIQNTLRDELNYYYDKNPDEFNSKGLLELPYLDGVVREVLRLYPPFTIITRVCQEDTVIPLAYPINTPAGKISSIPIKKGTVIFLNSLFYNRHEDIWGERASEFLPERWIGKKLNEVTQTDLRLPGVYSSMMTFGAGSYGCIGIKFAVMEIKTIIAGLIRKFRFEPATQECIWLNIGMQFPYLKADINDSKRSPKLFLKVNEL